MTLVTGLPHLPAPAARLHQVWDDRISWNNDTRAETRDVRDTRPGPTAWTWRISAATTSFADSLSCGQQEILSMRARCEVDEWTSTRREPPNVPPVAPGPITSA